MRTRSHLVGAVVATISAAVGFYLYRIPMADAINVRGAGSACHFDDGQNLSYDGIVGAIQNSDGTFARGIFCPLISGTGVQVESTAINSVQFFGYDQRNTLGVQVTVFGRGITSADWGACATEQTTNAFVGDFALFWDAAELDVCLTGSGRRPVAEVTLPPASGGTSKIFGWYLSD